MIKIQVSEVEMGILDSTYIRCVLSDGSKFLSKEGYRIPSLEENARLRIQEGKDSIITKYGNWVTSCYVNIPGKGEFLTKYPMVTANAKYATDRHENRKRIYLTDQQVEQVLLDCIEIERQTIPTNKFNDNNITYYLFLESAEKYGLFLEDWGIKQLNIFPPKGDYAQNKSKAFVVPTWFAGLTYNQSELSHWNLCSGNYVVLGVK